MKISFHLWAVSQIQRDDESKTLRSAKVHCILKVHVYKGTNFNRVKFKISLFLTSISLVNYYVLALVMWSLLLQYGLSQYYIGKFAFKELLFKKVIDFLRYVRA